MYCWAAGGGQQNKASLPSSDSLKVSDGKSASTYLVGEHKKDMPAFTYSIRWTAHRSPLGNGCGCLSYAHFFYIKYFESKVGQSKTPDSSAKTLNLWCMYTLQPLRPFFDMCPKQRNVTYLCECIYLFSTYPLASAHMCIIFAAC